MNEKILDDNWKDEISKLKESIKELKNQIREIKGTYVSAHNLILLHEQDEAVERSNYWDRKCEDIQERIMSNKEEDTADDYDDHEHKWYNDAKKPSLQRCLFINCFKTRIKPKENKSKDSEPKEHPLQNNTLIDDIRHLTTVIDEKDKEIEQLEIHLKTNEDKFFSLRELRKQQGVMMKKSDDSIKEKDNMLHKIKDIVEEAKDYNYDDTFDALPYKKVREIYDLVTFNELKGLDGAIREIRDISRDERENQ